eukprot:gene9095-10066_t
MNFKDIPPIIPPKQRQHEINTEGHKKSIYLKAAATQIDGDAMILSKILKDKKFTINQIDRLGKQDLISLASECKIENVRGASTDMLKHKLNQLYASILVGKSACHGFTKSQGHTGGFYHIVCRHGCTVASKFLILTESVRDAADLYLSLKHQPTLFFTDTACTFRQHINNRHPDKANELWGEYDGCFETPQIDRPPKSLMNAREIVPVEYSDGLESIFQETSVFKEMAALECFEEATETNSTDDHLDNEMNVTDVSDPSSHFSEARPKNRFYELDLKTFYHKDCQSTKNEQDRDPIFADFVLKIIGSVKYDGEKSWVCQCRSTNVDNPLETIEKNICLPGIAFTGPQRFTCHIHKQFRSDVVINGALQKSDVTDYLMHLKNNYMMMGEPREFKPAGVVGYLMGNTWILSDQQHLRNGHLVQPQEMEYVQVKGSCRAIELEIQERLVNDKDLCLTINRRYYELTNGFGANRDALLMATYFVLGRILRQTLPTMERRNTEMNVGKTLSQKILNLGQGSREEDGCLLLSGGDSVTGGTSITMLQKYLEDTTMVVMLNDLRFNRVNSEALLRYHEALYQGSRKEGMGKSKAAAILISSNEVEEPRLEGRVVRFNFARDDHYNKCLVQELRSLANNYNGLLLAWIIHHLKLWGKYEARLCQLLSAIFQRNLKKQQRWVDTLSTIVYTGYLYAATLGEAKSLLKEMETFLESELENGDIGVMQKIEKFVRNKIKENDSHILSWANWKVKVTQKGSGRLVPALAIKSQELKMWIKETDVKNALKSLTENDVAVSTYFSRSEDGCTLQDIQKRDSKKNSYRFPMCEFQQNLESWLDFGLNGGDQPLEEEVGPMMTDDEREILLEIDRNIRKDIEGKSLRFMTPNTKKEVLTFTPRRLEAFEMGMRVGSKRQLAHDLDTCTTDETAENDAPVVPEDPASSDEPDRFFTPGTIGVFSRQESRNINADDGDICGEAGENSKSSQQASNTAVADRQSSQSSKKRAKSIYCVCKLKRTKKEEDRMIVCESTKKKKTQKIENERSEDDKKQKEFKKYDEVPRKEKKHKRKKELYQDDEGENVVKKKKKKDKSESSPPKEEETIKHKKKKAKKRDYEDSNERKTNQIDDTKTSQDDKQNETAIGQWGSAQFESTAQKDKFIRLLGGFKNPNKESNIPNKFGGLKKFSSAAMSSNEEEKLNKKLESQYKQAFDTTRMKRGQGLGYDQCHDKDIKSFYIDKMSSKSVKLD